MTGGANQYKKVEGSRKLSPTTFFTFDTLNLGQTILGFSKTLQTVRFLYPGH